MTPEPGVAGYRSIPELVQHLSDASRERGLKIATAESCTGGMVSAAITDQPGASACYVGGTVAYCDDVKVRCLNVDPTVIGAHGAVSKLVALQMAFGARQRFAADVALAVTGIAGPRGGSPEKPVGTVWIAVAVSDGIGTARRMQFVGGRAAIRDRSVGAVLRLATEAIATHDL